ncbi:DUF1311 domain-containing protein [Mameliella sp. AT18]|uniref:lysozyme inhibitor LprI family protein n=1 Tax=Mameliella sp. AT18 TaxID=3028385 RepID=UPI000AF2CF74|nr:lysozyme inhibitor LprI family protein [Mameliella sp. AT18]MDD9728523.1 DUF1311 domain-containing protein [Mameliella sp. AT18]
MTLKRSLTVAMLGLLPLAASADPSLECSVSAGSQVEIAECVAQAETAVDEALGIALRFASDAAKDLDEITRREVSLPALESGQAAWAAYRDAHCDFVGSTYGGGSGTGIAVRSCRVELGRARIAELMQYTQ